MSAANKTLQAMRQNPRADWRIEDLRAGGGGSIMSAEPRFESYRLEVRPIESAEGGGFLVALPELEGCLADGATYDEAIAHARDAFAAWVSVARSLARAAAEGVSLNTLLTVFVATGLERPAVSRGCAPRRKAVG
jgi:antitoxin HicB